MNLLVRSIVGIAFLLFLVEATHAISLKLLEAQAEAQRQQKLLQQQQQNPLICRFIVREGAGWCRTIPTGRPSYVRGGSCTCGGFKLRDPFNETILGPIDGTLAFGPAPTNASGGFEFFARYGCDNYAKAYRGLC